MIAVNVQSSVITFLSYLNEVLKIKYVWLHGYNSELNNDIDISIEPPAFRLLDQIIRQFSIHSSFKIVQLLQHEYCAKYYVLARNNDAYFEYLVLDICSDYVRNRRVLIEASDLLTNRRYLNNYYICSPESEAEYLFVKRTLKMSWEEKHWLEIKYLYNQDRLKVINRLKRYLSIEQTNKIESYMISTDVEKYDIDLQIIRKNILKKAFLSEPLIVIKYHYNNVLRIISRIFNPTGLKIVFLGTDGSGKSTVISQLQKSLLPMFRQVNLFHWKPDLLFKKKCQSNNSSTPHLLKPRTRLGSYLKLIVYLAEYLLGYIVITIPQKIRSTLIIYDRYAYDMLIDQKRFRLKVNQSIIKALLKTVPSPDLIIYLEAPVGTLLSRKQELPQEEILRQVGAFREFTKKKSCGYIVDASQPLDHVVKDVENIVLDFMQSRMISRLD